MLKNKNIFPFTLALYPLLYLYGLNASELRPVMLVRAIFIVIICTIVLMLIYRLSLSDKNVASYLTAFSVIMLLSYGHVYHALRDQVPGGLQLIRHRFLIPAVIIIYVLIFLWIKRNRDKLSKFTPFINICSIALLVFPVFQIVRAEVQYQSEFNTTAERNSSSCILSIPEGRETPDIYLIILDAYTRKDVLLERYNFDNEPFLEELRKLGFYIAESAQSNYAMTSLSLRSSLNMDYLMDHSGGDKGSNGNSNLDGLRDFPVVTNKARTELECLGYKVVSFDSGWPITSWHNADYFFSPQKI
jgi:glucan phosphoethanolaminetransferase (alkaline phosphatase superfamily)